MSKGRITPKQEEILNFIKQHILSKNYPPSVREICEAVNLKSTSSVHAHLATLEKNGYISRDQSKTRAIEIVDDELLNKTGGIVRGLSGSPIIQNGKFVRSSY